MEEEKSIDIVEGSDAYERYATKGIVTQIIKFIFFILSGVAIVYLYNRFFPLLDNPAVPATIILLLNSLGPVVRGFNKLKLTEIDRSTGTISYEQTLGFQGFVFVIISSIVIFIIGSFAYADVRFAFLTGALCTVITIFGIVYPIANSIFMLITYIKVRKSAKAVNVLVNDTTTDAIFMRGFTLIAWVKYVILGLLIVCIVAVIAISVPQSKKAVIYKDALDESVCIMNSDIEEDIVEELLKHPTTGKFNTLYNKYITSRWITEEEYGHTVHKEYILDFRYNEKDGEWELYDYEDHYNFILWGSDEEFEQGGLFEGKGKLIEEKGKPDILLAFDHFDTISANGTLKLTNSDEVLESKFESVSVEEIHKKFLFWDISYNVEYILELKKPFAEDDRVKVVYDANNDKMQIEYMEANVGLERYIGEE